MMIAIIVMIKKIKKIMIMVITVMIIKNINKNKTIKRYYSEINNSLMKFSIERDASEVLAKITITLLSF